MVALTFIDPSMVMMKEGGGLIARKLAGKTKLLS